MTRPILTTVTIVTGELIAAGAIMAAGLLAGHAATAHAFESSYTVVGLDGQADTYIGDAAVDNRVCAFEDGNPDGLPCIWLDRDSGLWYLNDGSNYTNSEDEPGWDCVDSGNRICGPGNPRGVPAGLYDSGGVLVDPWPVN